MNCEGWSSGATKLGWVDRATDSNGKMGLTRHGGGVGVAISNLGMQQLMVAWVLGSSVTAWAAASHGHGIVAYSLF